MPKRSFAMALAMALFAGLAFSAPSQAGTFVTTVTAVNNTGLSVNDFEAFFTGTGGTVSDIKVLFSSGVATTTETLPVGSVAPNGTGINFNTPLTNGGVLVYQFDTQFGTIALNSAVWTFKSGAPITATAVSIVTTQAVPEPASMALLGIGMAGFLSFRRFFKRKAIV
jgi:hypothetical protein